VVVVFAADVDAFPGRRGAPKIRARQLISELEGTASGPHAICVGCFSFHGILDP